MRYGLMTAAYGALLSIMNTFNAELSAVYGNWGATVMIHLTGLLVLAPFAFTWGRRRASAPWYLYLGGLIGILTVVFVNVGVSGIGVTGNLVLMLLGQVACSAAVDHFGLLGASVHRVNRWKVLAIAVMACGCGAMAALSGETLGGGWGLAAVLSFLSGVTMILARMANAALATRSGVGYSTVMNYVTGLAGSLLVFACLGFRLGCAFPASGQPIWIYLGGALGALGILLCNLAAPKLPALQFSVIAFVGQIFTGMAIDAMSGRFSLGTLAGGLLVACGMYLNIRADSKEAADGNADQP